MLGSRTSRARRRQCQCRGRQDGRLELRRLHANVSLEIEHFHEGGRDAPRPTRTFSKQTSKTAAAGDVNVWRTSPMTSFG